MASRQILWIINISPVIEGVSNLSQTSPVSDWMPKTVCSVRKKVISMIWSILGFIVSVKLVISPKSVQI
jgi:hypothetical protein